jgi:hypothetical protein
VENSGPEPVTRAAVAPGRIVASIWSDCCGVVAER